LASALIEQANINPHKLWVLVHDLGVGQRPSLSHLLLHLGLSSINTFLPKEKMVN
jgi:hypothetical protein